MDNGFESFMYTNIKNSSVSNHTHMHQHDTAIQSKNQVISKSKVHQISYLTVPDFGHSSQSESVNK